MALLELRQLGVHFPDKTVVRDLDLSLERGATIGIIGESGSGKSLSGLACLGLLPPTARASGSIRFDGEELLNMPPRRLIQLRGRRIAMVFQDAGTALTPWLRIGTQLTDPMRNHLAIGRREAQRRAVVALEEVSMPEPERALSHYPHEFSGGQRQRILLAIALAGQPDLLIADEPTTALDVTIQAQILELLSALQRERGLALLFISHDLAAVNQIAENAVVMDAGEAVERGPVWQLFQSPQHPSTRALMRAISRRGAISHPGTPRPSAAGSAALSIRGLRATYSQRTQPQGVLHGIDLELRRGEIVALVGESGAGKSTLARVLLQLLPASSGELRIDGKLLSAATGARRQHRSGVQMIFQDPYASLNPRLSVEEALAEPIRFHGLAASGAELTARVVALLAAVGLDASAGSRYPHAFSGGQRQRIAIARALATEPELLVADEPVSALDIVTQCEILELLFRIITDRSMSMLLISHDLEMVRGLADYTAVIHGGVLVEQGPTEQLFAAPRDAQTRRLLAASPSLPATR